MKTLHVRLALMVALLTFVAFNGGSLGTSTLLGFRTATAQGITDVVGPVRGNKTSKIYHWRGCPEYDKIAPEHVVEFPDAAAAEAAGYRAARNCPKGNGNASTRKVQPTQPSSTPPPTSTAPSSHSTANPKSDVTTTTKASNSSKNVNTSADTSSNSNARVKSSKANKNANTSADTSSNSNVRVKSSAANKNANISSDTSSNSNARVKSKANKNANTSADTSSNSNARVRSKANKNANTSADTSSNSNVSVKNSKANKNANTSNDAASSHSRVKVWVNTDSGIYECSGSALYGKTKKGAYMTQGAAEKKGFHPAGNKICQ